jgi:hypothetical protein
MCFGDIRLNAACRWKMETITINGATQFVPENPTRVGLVLSASRATTGNLHYFLPGGVGLSGLFLAQASTGGQILTYGKHGRLVQLEWTAQSTVSLQINVMQAFAPIEVIQWFDTHHRRKAGFFGGRF